MATFPIYQIYVELEGYDPKMWRRFQIMNDLTLSRLAYIIMTLYELRENYSYEFRQNELEAYLKKHPEYTKHPERLERLNRDFNNRRYGILNKKNMYMYRKTKDYDDLQDVTKAKLKNILTLQNSEIIFLYDPEVNWKIKVILEKVLVDKRLYAKELPKVLDGEGYGIIEECAGVKELKKFRDNLKENKWKNNSNYKYFNLLDQKNKFYFDKLDIEDMNFRVKTLPRALMEYYELNMYDTYRIFKIKQRRYKVYRKKTSIYIDKNKK